MKNTVKRTAVTLMCLLMILFLFPVSAQAEDDEFRHTGLILNTNYLELSINRSFKLLPEFSSQIADQEVFWSSSDSSVAVVDSNGIVTAQNKIGTAEITCQLVHGLYYDTCTVETGFRDVPLWGEYYSTPVYWAYWQGITKGYTSGQNAGCFGTYKNCSRKDLAIFLWRYAGMPAGYGDARTMFNDMDAYGPASASNQAVAWAHKNDIVKGYSDGGFHPTDPILRKEVMIILYRYIGKPEVSGTMKFTDCQMLDKNSDTYKAILWGAQNGITKGYSTGPYAGQFGIRLTCQREEVITFLYRYNNLITG